MATTIGVIVRDGSANGLAELTALLAKLRVTGTPGAIFNVTVATPDDDRADAVMANLANDPRVATAGYQ